MSVFFFKLNDVPQDESDEIRQILRQHSISFYETDAGRFGLSTAAIWLRDASQLELARSLIDQYQQARTLRVRAEYAQLRREGRVETVWSRLKRHPIQVFFLVLTIALVLYLSTKPFLTIGS